MIPHPHLATHPSALFFYQSPNGHKISAPFRLSASQRRVLVNGHLLDIASPSGRQQGDYLYSSVVTLLREDAAVYTTAPCWASVEVR